MSQCSGSNYQVEFIPFVFDIVGDAKDIVNRNKGQIVDHSIDVVTDTINNSPSIIVDIINSKQFENVIRKAAQQYLTAQKKHNNGEDIDLKKAKRDALDMIIATGSEGYQTRVKNQGAVKTLQKDVVVLQQEMNHLSKELKGFAQAFECTPTGIWLNENKTKLIVVGAVGIIGGTVYMYKQRTGDGVAKFAMDRLKNKLAFATNVGQINIKTAVTSLVPSRREIGLDLSAHAKWKYVQASVNINAVYSDPANEDRKLIANVSSSGSLNIPLNNGFKANAGLQYKTKSPINIYALSDGEKVNDQFLAYLNVSYNRGQTKFQLNANTDGRGKTAVGVSLSYQW